MLMEISGSTIRAYRERLELTQKDFADRLGMSQGLISLIELGRGSVSKRLLKRLQLKSEEGAFKLGFSEFLTTGGMVIQADESEFRAAQPIPLEPWTGRIDLRKPADKGTEGRIYLPGLPEGARAFHFNPSPRFLDPNTIAVFRPTQFIELIRDQVVLIQIKVRHGTKELPASIAHLGRAIVVRRGRRHIHQFEAADPNVQVAVFEDESIEVAMTCCFCGKYCL